MVNLKQFTIGVLRGGPSSEREISLLSGEAVLRSLIKQGYRTVDIVLPQEQDLKFLQEWVLSQLRSQGVDVCFIALHGWFGEDGKIQEILDRAGYRYTGSGPRASRLAMDKIASRRIFELNGIPVPQYKVYESLPDCFPEDMNFPVIVKPSSQGSSVGLSKIDGPSQFFSSLREALSYDGKAIVEEFIFGMELTVGILNEVSLPVIRIHSHLGVYNYQAKYTPGYTDYIVPADIPEEIAKKAQKYAIEAHSALGCRCFSRVDMVYSLQDGDIYVLEVNTIPGLTTSSLLPKAARAAGINFDELVEIMLKSALNKDNDVCEIRKTETGD